MSKNSEGLQKEAKAKLEAVKEAPKKEAIAPQDLAAIKDMRTKNAFIAARAEKAILESRVSEAELRNAILNIYIKYGLTAKDTIDENTGEILKNTAQEGTE